MKDEKDLKNIKGPFVVKQISYTNQFESKAITDITH